MKKTVLIFACFCVLQTLFSEETVSAARRKFIKGNIADKTQAVKEASGAEPALAESGLDFVLANQALLGNDRDIAALAIASILALPKDAADKAYADRISEKLVQVFTGTNDQTVAIAVLDKLVPLAELSKSANTVALLNTQLTTLVNQSATPVSVAVLRSLGTLGNSDSFVIVYSIWRNNLWPQYADDIEAALTQLSVRSVSDAAKAVMAGDIPEVTAYFTLLKKNAKNMQNFLAEIAENVLSKTIYSVEGFSSELADLQLSALSVIADAQWARASKLVIRFFADAKEAYAAGKLSEAQFAAIIQDVAKLASPDSAATLSAYLADLNRSTAENAVPAKSVVLAVISALGELGDKTAFDTLLYVTYLSYPDEVIQAARASLARLKW